jgi:hypothetical protein
MTSVYTLPRLLHQIHCGRLRLKCDGTSAETRFHLSMKRTSPFKLAGTSVQSTTGSRGVRISGSYAGYTMFRGSVKSAGYTLHSPVSPSLPLLRDTMCHHLLIHPCYLQYFITQLEQHSHIMTQNIQPLS